MRGISTTFALLVLSCCDSSEPLPAPLDVAIEVGRPFPNLVLPSLEDGSPSSIARFRGQKTLLHVFASW